MQWWLIRLWGEDIFAEHVEFLLLREIEDINSRGVELVVGDVDQPGAEEASPANCHHDNYVERLQIVVIAVGILHLDLDSLFLSDFQSRVDGQTEKKIYDNIFKSMGIFIIRLPEKHEEEYEEIKN